MQRVTQNCFTKGELDPTLLARYDVDIYQKGARKIRNMVSLWTGAVRIAPGSLYIDVIMDRTASPPAPITDYTQVSGVIFEYNAEESIQYTIILRPDTTSGVAIDTYLNGSLTASIPATVYDVSDIPNIDFAVGQDRVLFLNENIQPQQLVNNGTSSSWTFSAFNFSVLPVFDYTVLGGTQYRVSGFTFTPSATTNTVRYRLVVMIDPSLHPSLSSVSATLIGRLMHSKSWWWRQRYVAYQPKQTKYHNLYWPKVHRPQMNLAGRGEGNLWCMRSHDCPVFRLLNT